jgi:hypothetical protein
MADDDQTEKRTGRATTPAADAQRSIDPQTVIDGIQAFGVATGGTGALLAGIAKLKDSLGSGQSSETPAKPQAEPKAE